jgi:hypothetical protein
VLYFDARERKRKKIIKGNKKMTDLALPWGRESKILFICIWENLLGENIFLIYIF